MPITLHTFSTPVSAPTGHLTSSDPTVASHDNLATAIEALEAAVQTLESTTLGSSLLYIRWTGGTVPLRNTVTTDATRVVCWIGPVTPPFGGGYAEAVDVSFRVAT